MIFNTTEKVGYLPEGRIINISEITAHLKSTSDWGEVTNCYLVEIYRLDELIYSYFDCETYYIWISIEVDEPEDEGGGDSGDTGDWYNPGGGDPETPSCDLGYTLDKDGNCIKSLVTEIQYSILR